MKLIKFEGYSIHVTEELMFIKPFRKIWNRDRSEYKEKALMEIGYIYFMYDPRSSYNIITDIEDREDKVKQDVGLPLKWKPDILVKEASDIYKSLTSTTSSLLMESCRIAINKVRESLMEVDLNKIVDGKRVYTEEGILKSVKQSIDLLKSLSMAEEDMYKEIADKGKMRGGNEKTIMEDDLDI